MATKPDGLGDAGSALWDSLTDGYEYRPDELRVLRDACREADLISLMEEKMVGAELIVEGSMKQPVANPMLGELRQHRALLERLLRSLNLPDESERPSLRSANARNAANARWRRGA